MRQQHTQVPGKGDRAPRPFGPTVINDFVNGFIARVVGGGVDAVGDVAADEDGGARPQPPGTRDAAPGDAVSRQRQPFLVLYAMFLCHKPLTSVPPLPQLPVVHRAASAADAHQGKGKQMAQV